MLPRGSQQARKAWVDLLSVDCVKGEAVQHFIHYPEIPILPAFGHRTGQPLVLFQTALLNRFFFAVFHYLKECLETISKPPCLVLNTL